MNDKQKNKVIVNVPPYVLGLLGIMFGIGVAAFTNKSGIAGLIIIFSIVAAFFLYAVLENIFDN